MKKIILTFVITSICLTGFGQGFHAGANLGIPVGDAQDAYNFTIGGDIKFLWELSESIDVGLVSGFNYYTGGTKSKGGGYIIPNLEIVDFAMIPIAGALSLKVSDTFSFGVDVGYGIIIGKLKQFGEGHSNGGFYYRLMAGYNVTEAVQITISYRAASIEGGTFGDESLDGGTIGAFTVGVNFDLNKM
jgi:hypothetical protein